METLNLNTEVCPLVCISTYGTVLSCDGDDESEEQYIDEQLEDLYPDLSDDLRQKCKDWIFGYTFDFPAYLTALGKQGLNWIEREYLPILKANFPSVQGVQCEGVWSPKEYNFRGDSLDFTLEYEGDLKAEIGAFVSRNKEAFFKWSEKYCYCDGFISFMPWHEEDFAAELEKGEKLSPCVSMAFEFACLEKIEENEKNYPRFMEFAKEAGANPGQFYNYELGAVVAKIMEENQD